MERSVPPRTLKSVHRARALGIRTEPKAVLNISALRRLRSARNTGSGWRRGDGSARDNREEWQRYRRVTISPAARSQGKSNRRRKLS